jgi:molecular chaperone DnaK
VSTPSLCIRKTIGIDLGTTNSVIALLDPTDSRFISGKDERGRPTIPSVVGYDPQRGDLIAGRAAQALRSLNTPGPSQQAPTLPLASVKRFMGLERAFALGHHQLTPPDVSACILRHLRDLLGAALQDPRFLLDSAIIAMPAYFNHNQIEATRHAGEQAGFEVVELLHEPTAAAIYYSWTLQHGDATYLVYDLGGGTFDVSVIRHRLDDYEVLSVSGDPFLGGDDFDRLLASHLLECGRWTAEGPGGSTAVSAPQAARLFDLGTPSGTRNFARLVQVAEGIKIELTGSAQVRRDVPELVRDEEGRALSLEACVERVVFERLIRDKVVRTIDCCHEALARASERARLSLTDIDHVVLVGGSSRVPLVRETVRAAFCNPDLSEHVRSLEPLLHEPDLCVAYGAALRAATHGTRYLFRGLQAQESEAENTSLELHLTSPVNTREVRYLTTGVVRSETPDFWLDGGSVRIRSLETGLTDEAFLDERGTFSQEVELQPEGDNRLEFTVCDGAGREAVSLVVVVRHRTGAQPLGQAVLPTQLITKPLQIEVLTRGRQRVKQIVAPVGASLPGVFRCTCYTHDQSARIVVPIYEENRVVKQMVLADLDRTLPIGSPVEVEFRIDVKHQIEVRVRVRQGVNQEERCETATIEAPPPPGRPTRGEIDEVQRRIDDLLPQFSGRFRTRMRARATQLRQDLVEALQYEDEPRAVQRFAELLEMLQQLQASHGQALQPPWPHFAQLVRHCLELTEEVASRTGRDREELAEHIRTQERYAEQAYEEYNQALYRECADNLEKYAGYLRQLQSDLGSRPPRPSRSPEEEARAEVERFRAVLSAVWKQVRVRQRPELEERLSAIARRAQGLRQRIPTEPLGVLRETHRLGTEIDKVSALLQHVGQQTSGDDTGLLEGSQ